MLDLIPAQTPLAWALAALAGAAVIIGIAKSGFGGGIGILAVPLTAGVLRPQDALGVLLPVLIVADIVAMVQHRGQQSWRHLGPAFVGAAVGIAAGTLLLWWFREAGSLKRALNLTIGGVCLFFVVVQVYRLMGGAVPRVPDRAASSVVAGGVAGGVSTLAHSAGPIMSIYLLEQKLEKRRMVGTLVFFFFAVNLAKLPSFYGLGWIGPETLAVSGAMVLLVPIGSLMGLWMHRRVQERPFVITMYCGAAAAAAWMIFKEVG